MELKPRQVMAVLALPGDQRYRHFVKVIADRQEAWGLYKDGWALAADDNGSPVFALWPAKEYAALCAEGHWADYVPRAIRLSELLEVLLPKLKHDGLLPGIFFTPSGKGVTPSIDELVAALEAELRNY